MTAPFRSDLETAAARAWGSSNPVDKAERELAAVRTALRAEISAAVSAAKVSFVQGLLEDPADAFAVPGAGVREVDVSALQVIFDDRGVPVLADTVTILRPMDGVTREFLGVAVDDGGGGVEPDVYETHGALAASPVVERLRDGVYTTLTLGVDYTENLALGTITLIGAAPNIDPLDTVLLTAAWSGTWTASVVALSDGTLTCRRGYTLDPSRGWADLRGVEFGEVVLFQVHDVTDATTTITVGMIDFRPADYLSTSAMLRFFSGPRAHTHNPSTPHDGGPLDSASLGYECFWEYDGNGDAILRPAPFSYRPDGKWANDGFDVMVSGYTFDDTLWEYDVDNNLVLKAV